jgi:hypothetical protein
VLQRIGYVVVLVALGLASPAQAAAPPQTPSSLAAAVRVCVESNLTRYNGPGTAVLAQYISLVAACRAALTHEQDVELTLTPLRGTGSRAAVRAKTEPERGSTQAPAAPAASSPGAHSPARTAPARSSVATCPECAIPQSSAQTQVRAALADSPRPRRFPALAGLDAAPAWLLWLVGALALAAVSTGAVRDWRRPR